MPESPLSALVEGYTQGQDQKLKKAREIAQQQADAWERRFRVQQAKDHAAQQEIQNQFESRRVATEEQQAKLREKAIEETERKNKAHEDFQKTSLTVKQQLDGAKGDFKKWQSVWQGYIKTRDQLIYKGDIDPRIADEMTRWMLSETDANILGPQGQGAPVPMPGTQPPQDPQGQGSSILSGTGNPLASILQQMQGPDQPGQNQGHMPGRYAVRPPVEGMPESAGSALPGQAAALAYQQERAKAEAALTEQRKAQAHVLAVTADATKALKTAEATEHAEKAKIAKAQAQMAVQKGEAEIKHLRSETAHALASAQTMLQQSKLNEQKFALDKRKAEAELSGSSRSAIDKYARDINAWRKEQVSFQEQIGKTYESMAKLHVLLDPGVLEGMKDSAGQPKYSPIQIQTMRRGASDSMQHQLSMQQSLRIKVDKLQAEIDYTQPLVDKARRRTVTTPSGAPEHKEQNAHEGAAARDARASERKASASHRQVVTPPKKKIEKKGGKWIDFGDGVKIREREK